jgi:uncharacterized protein (DUF1330 family)
MAAYLIGDIDITDPAAFEEYRMVVLEFPTMEQAKRWYECEEYRAPRALRIKASRSNVIFVEGI